MKISSTQREANKKKILEAAVKLMAEKGFAQTSLREIAKQAGTPEPTIYKYYPSKEAILHYYFDVQTETLIGNLKKIKDFEKFSFQEQFHSVLDAMFDLFEPDRTFIQTAYQGVFRTNWIAAAEASEAAKARFLAIINGLLDAAIESGEIEELPFRDLVVEIFWEYSLAVTYYWLADVSPRYENTTQLIDKSLGLITSYLTSAILGKSYDLIKFLVREHLLSRINRPPPGHFPRPKAKGQIKQSNFLRTTDLPEGGRGDGKNKKKR